MAVELNTRFSFGEFEIDPGRRLLLRGDEVVPIKGRTFDLLLTLVENHGKILSKDKLLDEVWEAQFVEENNLTVHVAALRKALGETKNENRYIVTVPGKGYRFVGDVQRDSKDSLIIESRRVRHVVIEEAEVSIDDHVEKPLISGRRRTHAKWIYGFVAIAIMIAGIVYFRGALSGSTNTDGAAVRTPVMRAFGTTGGIPQRVSISADGKQLAYVERSKGKDSIWIGDIETNQSRRLTEASDRLHNSLTFAPDGKSVYVTARDANHPNWTLMRVSLAGGSITDLKTEISGNPTFSPDAASISYYGPISDASPTALVIADSATLQDKRAIFQSQPGQKLRGRGPAWSHDGKKIAVGISGLDGRGCDIMVVEVDNGSAQKLGNNACDGSFALTWLADGGGLVISAPNDEAAAYNQLWLVSYPAGEKTRLTDNTSHYSPLSVSAGAGDRIALLEIRHNPDISVAPVDDPAASKVVMQGSLRSDGLNGVAASPDGNILYIVRIGGRRSIWEMKPDGSDQRPLVPSDENSDDMQISVTPDNRFLVFQSARSGVSEVWRANRDGTGLLQLTSGGRNGQPTLSPDGQHVYFTSNRTGGPRVWRVSINGGEAEQVTYDQASWPDVSPDGETLACVTPVPGEDRSRIALYSSADGRLIASFETARSAALFNRIRWSPDGRAVIYKDIVQGLWRQPIEGGDPKRFYNVEDLRIFHFAFTTRGEMIHSSGVQERQIVIMENFR